MHDWGGPIGMRYATRHPDNVGRLVVMNTIAFWMPRIPLGLRVARLPGVGPLAVRRLDLFLRVALRVACHHRERMTADVRAGYRAPYDSYANRIAQLRFVEDIPVNDRHPTFRELAAIEARLPALRRRPMLVIWGERDPIFTGRVLAGWRARFPEAEVRCVRDAGHWVLEDAHERIVPWIRDFLRS
jgi:haloalkane dehalogenase